LFEGIGAKVCLDAASKETNGIAYHRRSSYAKQVEDALTFDVDVLWIGARTTG